MLVEIITISIIAKPPNTIGSRRSRRHNAWRVPLSRALIRRCSNHLRKFDACAIALFISSNKRKDKRCEMDREKGMKREASVIKHARGTVDNGSEREKERERDTRHEVARVRGSVDAKYRQGCQVAETAAAPLSTGTSWFSSGGRGGLRAVRAMRERGIEGARSRHWSWEEVVATWRS